MKTISLYCPHQFGKIRYPKEDAWAIDPKNKVFAVADGVHLRKGIEYKNKYPRPSPAGRLAQKFCDEFVKRARRGSLKNAFRAANRRVSAINKNRDKFSVFQNASCYYAATGAFIRFRGRRVDYGNICDAGVAAIDSKGKILFWNRDHSHHHGFSLSRYSTQDQSYLLRTIFRNALGKRGNKIGYGVITGEKEAEPYVKYGRAPIGKGVVYILMTDGFECYFKNMEFRKTVISLDKNKIAGVMETLRKRNIKNREFSHERTERTLVAIKP